MSVYYCNKYWLLGDNADEEAKRWVALDECKQIVYSSPRAVELYESGKHLPPELPIPPEGFTIVVISYNDMDQGGLILGVADWCGNGGWIEPKDQPENETVSPGIELIESETTESMFSEEEFLNELEKL